MQAIAGPTLIAVLITEVVTLLKYVFNNNDNDNDNNNDNNNNDDNDDNDNDNDDDNDNDNDNKRNTESYTRFCVFSYLNSHRTYL